MCLSPEKEMSGSLSKLLLEEMSGSSARVGETYSEYLRTGPRDRLCDDGLREIDKRHGGAMQETPILLANAI